MEYRPPSAYGRGCGRNIKNYNYNFDKAPMKTQELQGGAIGVEVPSGLKIVTMPCQILFQLLCVESKKK